MRRTNGTWITLGLPALAIGLALAATAAGEFYKNTTGQKMMFFARDMATGLPKTGDAANITARVSIDGGVVHALVDTSASEVNATTAQGWYKFDVSQAETNGNMLLFTAGSSTSDVNLAGCLVITRAYTVDANGHIESVVKAASDDANLADTTDVVDAVETGLDNQGYTAVRAAYLDYLATLITTGVTLGWQFTTTVDAGVDNKTFTLVAGPSLDNWFGVRKWKAIVQDADDDMLDAQPIVSYTASTKTLVLAENLKFTPAASDAVFIIPAGGGGGGGIMGN